MEKYWLILLPILFVQSLVCQVDNSRKSLPDKKPVHTTILIGDVGHLSLDNKESYTVLSAVKSKLELLPKESSIVFLGDNIYPIGFPDKNEPFREEAELKMNLQMDILSDFQGNAYMIPGNYDWAYSGERGLENIMRLEEYVESYYSDDDKIKYLPGKGCGATKTRKITKGLTYIFIDSEWWFRNDKYNPLSTQHCDIKTRGDYLELIRSTLVRYRNDKVVIFMHHPIKSLGHHSGSYSLREHIFPLTNINDNLYLPLPVIGSIPPIIKGIYGSKQDLSHPEYKLLMDNIVGMVKSLEMEVVFVSGHEHGMSYFAEEDLHYIVSGGGSVSEHLGKKQGELYAKESLGFAMIYLYEGEEMWIEFYDVDKKAGEVTVKFRSNLYPDNTWQVKMETAYPPLSDSQTYVTVSPNKSYNAGSLKKYWFGKQYRDIWATPITIPVINLEEEAGGLIPTRLGGGKSSYTLRLESSDGHQYNLRSVDKFYFKNFGETYKNVKIFRLIQDMVSAHYPYAPLLASYLSEATDVYYTDPKLVYLRYQRALRGFNESLPEGIYWLEQRPTDKWEMASNFGYAKDIIGYQDLLEKLRTKNNHYVDQEWVLKSRLLDMWIHDWDRHGDNCRWAVFKEGDKTIYRPVPRDRDMAFYKMEGIFPSIVSNFVERKLLPFRDEIKDVRHLNENAGDFDRRFLNELEWGDWENILEEFLNKLTDSIITSSFDVIPEQVQNINREEFVSTLQKRKKNIKPSIREYYLMIAEEVVVVGTDNKDVFSIDIEDNGFIQLSHYITKKNNEQLLKYERLLSPAETKRIIIYGLEGEDEYYIVGNNKTDIRIMLIGGGGIDRYFNPTSSMRPEIYDYPENFESNGSFNIRSCNDFDINSYRFAGYEFDRYYHIADIGINKDDGLWLSYGQFRTYESWPYTQYASRHKYSISVAPASAQFIHFNYRGTFNNVLGKKFQFSPVLSYRQPTYVNYFGIGNNTENTSSTNSYNWVRMHEIFLNPNVIRQINFEKIILSAGPQYRSVKIINKENRITDDESYGFTEDDFSRKNFLGFRADIILGFQDHPRNPKSGFGLQMGGNYQFQLDADKTTREFSMSTHFYIPLKREPSIVFANDIGFNYIWGVPEFYQLPSIGQNDHLRGWRNNRFRGSRAFYQNMDLRIHLVDFYNEYLPMDIGLVCGFDYGKVWVDEENSRGYHSSWSVGLSLDVLYLFTLHPYISFSEEGTVFSMMTGHRF